MSLDGKFVAFSCLQCHRCERKLHELRFLISLPRTMRLWSLKRWSFVNAGSLPTTWHLMRLSSSLASASHSACGLFQCSFIGKFEHILSHCVHSPFSLPVAQWQLRTKNTTLLFSLYVSFRFSFSSILFLVKLGLVKAQSTYFCNKQRHSESLQVSRESCQVWGFSVFLFFFFPAREKGCKLTCRGVRLCWLQETDALQEFWKQTRLTLFSRPWLLFSPLFWRYKQVPFKSYCLAFLL